MKSIEIVKSYENLKAVLSSVLEIWPEHDSYCYARFCNDTPEFLDRMNDVARLVLLNTGGDIDRYARSYRKMCEDFLEEEFYFARNKEYRLKTFQEAYTHIYSNKEYMESYVRGILISQVLWDPHARAFDFFKQDFLNSLPNESAYLEVGPGHGLFLYYASKSTNIRSLEAWDVSQSSIAETQGALGRLQATRDVKIVEQDVLLAPPRANEFDAAVISEVLEHLEQPALALRSLHAALKPGGLIFINIPINSPAPDHIYLWRTSEAVVDLIKSQGFEIVEVKLFPVTGVTLQRAERRQLSISCVVIGRKK
jgi:SAM-dependent methyltransferase